MSFGFSISDVLQLSALVYQTAKKIKAAPDNIEDLEHVVESVQDLLKSIETNFSIILPRIERDLALKGRFQHLLHSFETPLIQLNTILRKYERLRNGKFRLLDRVLLPTGDILTIQNRLHLRYAALNAFLQTYGLASVGRIEYKLDAFQTTQLQVLKAVEAREQSHVDAIGIVDLVDCGVAQLQRSNMFPRALRAFFNASLQQDSALMMQMHMTLELTGRGTRINSAVESEEVTWKHLRNLLVQCGFDANSLSKYRQLVLDIFEDTYGTKLNDKKFVFLTPDGWNWRMVDITDLKYEEQLRAVFRYNLGLGDKQMTIFLTTPGQMKHEGSLSGEMLETTCNTMADNAGSLKLYIHTENSIDAVDTAIAPSQSPPGSPVVVPSSSESDTSSPGTNEDPMRLESPQISSVESLPLVKQVSQTGTSPRIFEVEDDRAVVVRTKSQVNSLSAKLRTRIPTIARKLRRPNLYV